MNVLDFMRDLKGLRTPNSFNPYADTCEVYDIPVAASRRFETLLKILERAADDEIDAIWIGRDLGYRGGRRTGLALTDEIHSATHGRRWNVDARVITKGPAVAERTAGVIWSTLSNIEQKVFLWNVFPLHPHLPNDSFTNRQHSRSERALGEEVLSALIGLLKPKRLVAIGNDAQFSAKRCSAPQLVHGVRHPSYGGQKDFLTGIQDLYGRQ